MAKVLPTDSQLLVDFIIKNFEVFIPWNDSKDILPRMAGNYVVLLKKETPFPTEKVDNMPAIRNIEFEDKEYQLIYTGITSELRKRIGNNHFGNNAGRSTLRLSLGSLMGFTKIYRDKKEQMKKFRNADELILTEWMQKNLIVLYYANPNCDNDEENMISALNPPLNIDKNNCKENYEFRSELSYLRSKNIQFEPIVE